jgi:hypothetical protein
VRRRYSEEEPFHSLVVLLICMFKKQTPSESLLIRVTTVLCNKLSRAPSSLFLISYSFISTHFLDGTISVKCLLARSPVCFGSQLPVDLGMMPDWIGICQREKIKFDTEIFQSIGFEKDAQNFTTAK